jgi:hypothetical protein
MGCQSLSPILSCYWWQLTKLVGRLNRCWHSPVQQFLVSVPVETHDYVSFPRLLRVLKWSLLFNEKRGLIIAGHSSLLGWLERALTLWLPHKNKLVHISHTHTHTHHTDWLAYFQLLAKLPRRILLYSIGINSKENTAPNSSIIAAGRWLAMADLYIELFPCCVQCLSSHVTLLPS